MTLGSTYRPWPRLRSSWLVPLPSVSSRPSRRRRISRSALALLLRAVLLALPGPQVPGDSDGRVNFGDATTATLPLCCRMVVGQLVSSFRAGCLRVRARIEFLGREVIWLFLGTMMIPASVLVIPLYLMMAKMGLNTFWGIVLPSCSPLALRGIPVASVGPSDPPGNIDA